MSACSEFRRRAGAIWEASFQHPCVRAIGNGTLDAPRFRRYIQQDYVFLIGRCRFLSLLQGRAPDLADMQTLSTVSDGMLRYEMRLHRDLAACFGIGPRELGTPHRAAGYRLVLHASPRQ